MKTKEKDLEEIVEKYIAKDSKAVEEENGENLIKYINRIIDEIYLTKYLELVEYNVLQNDRKKVKNIIEILIRDKVRKTNDLEIILNPDEVLNILRQIEGKGLVIEEAIDIIEQDKENIDKYLKIDRNSFIKTIGLYPTINSLREYQFNEPKWPNEQRKWPNEQRKWPNEQRKWPNEQRKWPNEIRFWPEEHLNLPDTIHIDEILKGPKAKDIYELLEEVELPEDTPKHIK